MQYTKKLKGRTGIVGAKQIGHQFLQLPTEELLVMYRAESEHKFPKGSNF